MQKIIDLLAKLESGESKKYSELREAIADYCNERGIEKVIDFDIRTKEGKQQLMALAGELTAKREATSEEIEVGCDGDCNADLIAEQTRETTDNRGTESADFDGVYYEFNFDSVPVYPQCPITCEFMTEADWLPEGGYTPSNADYLRDAASKEPNNLLIKALVKLLDDNAEMLTTEGLADLLEECRYRGMDRPLTKDEWKYPSLAEPWVMPALACVEQSFINRLLAAPEEFITDAEDRKGLDYYERIGKFIGSNGAASACYYHAIRDTIQMLQGKFYITASVRADFNCRGVEFTTFDHESQLLLTDIDRHMAKNFSSATARHFCYLAKMKTPKYNLSRIEEDDKGEFETPTTFRQIKELAKIAKHAILRHESHTWESIGNGSFRSTQNLDIPNEPDTIELTLILEWDGDPSFGNWGDAATFRLTHPDPSRKPWLAEELAANS